MASGKPWEDYVDYAIACVPEWEFGTKIVVAGETWECMDRGGAIQIVDGIPWVDFLQEKADYRYGAIVDAILIYP
jgi:hypothetical protein